jgi:hypothetical protein
MKGKLYLYSPYGPYVLYRASVPVQGCTIPSPFGGKVTSRLQMFNNAKYTANICTVIIEGPRQELWEIGSICSGVLVLGTNQRCIKFCLTHQLTQIFQSVSRLKYECYLYHISHNSKLNHMTKINISFFWKIYCKESMYSMFEDKSQKCSPKQFE